MFLQLKNTGFSTQFTLFKYFSKINTDIQTHISAFIFHFIVWAGLGVFLHQNTTYFTKPALIKY